MGSLRLSLMRFGQVAQAASRKNLAAVVFVGAFVASLVLSPSPTSAYDPQHSAVYEPLPQPRDGSPIRNTIVVPAYRERENIRALVTAVFDTLPHTTARETEILIVDDASDDGSEEEVKLLQQEGRNVDIVVRRGKGERGLSSAVLRGFERARGSKLLVMDADLQVSTCDRLELEAGKLKGLRVHTAPRRVCRTALRRAHGPNPVRDRHPLRRRRQHVQKLAHVPPHHFLGRARPRPTAHLRERPHVGLLRHQKGARTSPLVPLRVGPIFLTLSPLPVPPLQADQLVRVQDRARAAPEGPHPLGWPRRSAVLVRHTNPRLVETRRQGHAPLRRPAPRALRLELGHLVARARRGRHHGGRHCRPTSVCATTTENTEFAVAPADVDSAGKSEDEDGGVTRSSGR